MKRIVVVLIAVLSAVLLFCIPVSAEGEPIRNQWIWKVSNMDYTMVWGSTVTTFTRYDNLMYIRFLPDLDIMLRATPKSALNFIPLSRNRRYLIEFGFDIELAQHTPGDGFRLESLPIIELATELGEPAGMNYQATEISNEQKVSIRRSITKDIGEDAVSLSVLQIRIRWDVDLNGLYPNNTRGINVTPTDIKITEFATSADELMEYPFDTPNQGQLDKGKENFEKSEDLQDSLNGLVPGDQAQAGLDNASAGVNQLFGGAQFLLAMSFMQRTVNGIFNATPLGMLFYYVLCVCVVCFLIGLTARTLSKAPSAKGSGPRSQPKGGGGP